WRGRRSLTPPPPFTTAIFMGVRLNEVRRREDDVDASSRHRGDDPVGFGFGKYFDRRRAQVPSRCQREDELGDALLVTGFHMDDEIVGSQCEVTGFDLHTEFFGCFPRRGSAARR